jgi:hypothetical protein
MPRFPERFRPVLNIALPVAIAVVLVCLALVNIASVRTWRGEPEDGVLWQAVGANVVARKWRKARPANGPAFRLATSCC